MRFFKDFKDFFKILRFFKDFKDFFKMLRFFKDFKDFFKILKIFLRFFLHVYEIFSSDLPLGELMCLICTNINLLYFCIAGFSSAFKCQNTNVHFTPGFGPKMGNIDRN